MNLEERVDLWHSAFKADPREHALNELAKTEPKPTVPYILLGGVYILSPLGIALICHSRGGEAALKTFLERGASPNDVAELLIRRGYIHTMCDAFHLACRYKLEKPFRLLLEYATPDSIDGLTPAYMSWVDAKHERSSAAVCLGWLFTQMQRDDLIEPVVQRLASVPVDSWGGGGAPPGKYK
jgi:hypothetical protein